jgi:hypothetical protein
MLHATATPTRKGRRRNVIEEEMILGEDAEKILNASDEQTLPAPIFVRSEVNLLALPIFQNSWKRLHNYDRAENVYEYEVTRNGVRSTARFQLIHTEDYGRLTPFDANVRRAFDDLLDDRAAQFGYPLENPIPFSIRGLARSMRIANPGKAVHHEIKESIERMVATTIKSSGSWLVRGEDGEEATPIDDIFHIYDRAVFIGNPVPEEAGGGIADTNFLWLGSPYLQNINTRYVRPIDHAHLWSLKGILSRRLYELLIGRFYTMRKDHHHIAYSTLCRVLPAKQMDYYSDARKALDSAHRELLASGLLSRVVYQRLRGKQKLVGIRYYPGDRAKDELALARDAKRPVIQRRNPAQITMPLPFASEQDSESDHLSDLAQELHGRGVSQKEAKRLAQAHPDRIPEKLEYFDFLVATNSPLIDAKEGNPGGWLRQAVESDYALPTGVAKAKETRQRKQAEEDREQRWTQTGRPQLIEESLREWKATPPEKHIEARLKSYVQYSADFQALVRELGSKEAAAKQTKQNLLAELPQTDAEIRKHLEHLTPAVPIPSDFK